MARNPWYVGPGPEIEPEELEKYEKTGLYLYQPKMDGGWCEVEVQEKNILNSRDAETAAISGSLVGDLPTTKVPLPFGSKLAGELEAFSEWSTRNFEKTGIRHIYLFDALKIGDEDLRGLTTQVRYNRLAEIVNSWTDELLKERFRLVPTYYDNFLQHYQEEIAAGGEGCVLKRIDSAYKTYSSSGKTDLWVRCKKTYTEDYFLLGLTKTPKGTTTGRWGLYDAKGKPIDLFKAGPGQRVPAELLAEENIGKLVCEFEGKGKGRKGGLRAPAQWVRVREDKTPAMCVLQAA